MSEGELQNAIQVYINNSAKPRSITPQQREQKQVSLNRIEELMKQNNLQILPYNHDGIKKFFFFKEKKTVPPFDENLIMHGFKKFNFSKHKNLPREQQGAKFLEFIADERVKYTTREQKFASGKNPPKKKIVYGAYQ